MSVTTKLLVVAVRKASSDAKRVQKVSAMQSAVLRATLLLQLQLNHTPSFDWQILLCQGIVSETMGCCEVEEAKKESREWPTRHPPSLR